MAIKRTQWGLHKTVVWYTGAFYSVLGGQIYLLNTALERYHHIELRQTGGEGGIEKEGERDSKREREKDGVR